VAALGVEIGDTQYDHSTRQRRGSAVGDVLTFTMNATQTYAWNGRPNDADND
jgi:hypothetical protein